MKPLKLFQFFAAVRDTWALQRRITAVEEWISAVEGEIRAVLERCRRIEMRSMTAQRRLDEAEAAVESEDSKDAVPEEALSSQNGGRLLSSHQLQIQRQILMRRAGLKQ